jgi:hypothetical protein
MKNIDEIKTKVKEGKKVFWKNEAYRVIKDSNRYLIHCLLNNTYTGLNNDYQPKDFFIKE